MKQVWTWLNGKKTVIGVVAGAIIGALELSGALDAETAKILITVAGLIFGTGVVHKLYKAKTE